MEQELGFNEIKIYSFGDILVGLDSEEINESEEIIEIRKMFSKMEEIIKDNYNLNKTPIKSLLFDQTIGDIARAQLMIEKLLKIK